ncbi:SufB/SufD family protein [Amaricoccus macauensis]|uniref:SufB/SufD family protein n=1 Tax=Amaricoccus macauensis TaxID=57001 RepID=UPI003C7D81CC
MVVATRKLEDAGQLLDVFSAPSGESAWAQAARAKAEGLIRREGAPSRRDEYWKYTDPAALTCVPAQPASVLEVDEKRLFEDAERVEFVFVDGVFSPELSDAPELAGADIQPLRDALAADIHWAKDIFGVLEGNGQAPVVRPMAALNTARATEGFVIRVHGKLAKPISFVYLRKNEQADAMVRHVIRVEAEGDATILEDGPAAARFNSVLEVDVAGGGAFHHVRAQGRDHERHAWTGAFARLGQESTFKSFTLSMNGRLTRNECVIELTGDEAVAHVAGASIGEGDFRHDDTVFITHDAVDCESRQVFKKVLRTGATGIFQGKILVKPDAQKTDGYQISQSLLLDDDSQFLTKPELEIYADDVACSHGSTSGAVDETSLFYLRSRGLQKEEAEELLVLAFVDEAISEIENEDFADRVRERLAAWLLRHRG